MSISVPELYYLVLTRSAFPRDLKSAPGCSVIGRETLQVLGQLIDMALKASGGSTTLKLRWCKPFPRFVPTVKPDDVSHCRSRSGCNVEAAMFVLHHGGPPLALV